MEILLIAIYTSFCWAIFKIFKLPLNKWTIPTAILGGGVMIGAMLLVMNYNHPYSTLVREYYATTPMVPEVSGQVISVEVEADKPLKAGDVIFRIDPGPYQAEVLQREAELLSAMQKVGSTTASLETAQAQVRQAIADRDRIGANYRRMVEAMQKAGPNSAPFSAAQVETGKEQLAAAEAALQAAQSKRTEVEEQLKGAAGVEHPLVAQARAALQLSQWKLDSTVVRAPTDGYVTQLILRPGMMAVQMPLRPVAIFVHANSTAVVAAFWQNSLQRIKPGDEAEIIYRAVPGKIFKARVKKVLPTLAQGQLQASGTVLSVESVPNAGKVPVVLEIEEDLSAYNLPSGVIGNAAIYTEHAHHVALLRKILLRMVSWQNYIFGELH